MTKCPFLLPYSLLTMNVFVSMGTNYNCAYLRRNLQDLTKYTKSLQAQYRQHFCTTTVKEQISENSPLIRLDHREWDGAVDDSQQAIPLPETVQPTDSKKQSCVDLKEEMNLREEGHTSTNKSLPEEDMKEESEEATEEEDQAGNGLEEKEDEYSREAGDEGGQGEEIRRSEEDVYLGSAHEDDSE